MKKTCSRGHIFEKTSACPTCPMCWPKLKQKLLNGSDLPAGLGAPALRALDHASIHTLKQLSACTEKAIAALHGMGPKGITTLKAALRAKKLAFKK